MLEEFIFESETNRTFIPHISTIIEYCNQFSNFIVWA